MKKEDFPEADCESGYSWTFLEEVMDVETFRHFSAWMSGQTCCICDGRRYDHESKAYFPTECASSPHGGVAYRWDVHRFLGIIEGRDVWD